MKNIILVLLLITVLTNCNKNVSIPVVKFGSPEKVLINGYDEDIMEPFVSNDGQYLFFNNSNSPYVNTDLYWAVKLNDSTYDYKGEIKGINTSSYLEGVASMDKYKNFYFISTRSYDTTLSTIYKSTFSDGVVSEIRLVDGISKEESGWVNFDAEISVSGDYLYFTDGSFDQYGGPYESNIIISQKKTGDFFQRLSDQSMLKKVNTGDLEYAPCMSPDGLELYFTRVEYPLTSNSYPRIYIASRNDVDEAFEKPYVIENISGFSEGPSISADGKTIYYHKKESGKYVLYKIRKI